MENRQPSGGALSDVERLGPWFHNLHLPDGTQTCPDHFLGDFPSFKWRALAPHLPERLDGWSVLDIGCNAGFYSFELAKRGARVTGIDVEELYLTQARWAAQRLGLADRVTFRKQQVYSLARSREKWDLVMFMGVFYHLRYPLLALDAVGRRVGRMMVFQTLSMPGEDVETETADLALDAREKLHAPGWPKMAFIEHRLAGDRTNWWAPNHAAVEAMLRSTGMKVVGRPHDETYLCEPDRDRAESFWRWDTDEFASAIGVDTTEEI
jgi:tRNA (mo5U34)-methyltransferase